MFSKKANEIFKKVIDHYHIIDTVGQSYSNPYDQKSQLLEYLLSQKCWIDTVQWHYEDIIRDPNIDPVAALKLKRQIDASNQDRTDMVEYLDSYFLNKYKDIQQIKEARINSESPAWAIDRLSILALKIYHMQEEVNRTNATIEHIESCKNKLNILLDQRSDLSTAIDELLQDIENGDKYMKVYKQMKMYNDDELNPVLRSKNK